MKKFSFLLFLFCSMSAFAQDGFSIAANYGLGKSYERKAFPEFSSYYQTNWIFSSTNSMNTNLNVNFKKNHWKLESGIGFWIDGYTRSPEYTGLNNSGNLNGNLVVVYPNTTIYQIFKFSHIVLPVKLGYEIRLTKKLLIVQDLGVAISYNLNYTVNYKQNTSDSIVRISDNTFKEYRRFSSWITAQTAIAYKINERCAIAIGPGVAYMLSYIAKNGPPYYYSSDAYSQLKLYNYTINVSVTCRLPHKHASSDNTNK